MSESSFVRAEDYLAQFGSGTARQRARLVTRAPLADLHAAALGHPDPFVRRNLLGFLDHYASDESMTLFAEALHDPVDFVRNIALHSLACEPCKVGSLCVSDVVPDLVAVLRTDPSPDLRTKCIGVLLRLSARDPRARAAIERAAATDVDPLVRRAAVDALAGRLVVPRKRYQRQQRRHAKHAATA